ncbi:MAG: adenylate/guanylate cyclase domain-containing protein [Propionibacteriales bacterium]|nr:adenylate/guanylate cyclase domain-containing protein [Propionibacteriales bacterium]
MTEPEPSPPLTPASRRELEEAILGQEPRLTSHQVADGAGVSLDVARQLWRALGFPDVGDDLAFTDADLDALGLLRGTIESGEVDFETVIRLTRAVGHTMARLADWQVATLSDQIETGVEMPGRVRPAEITSDGLGAARMAQYIGPVFERLLVYAWRRHLAAAAGRAAALGAADEDLLTAQLTVGFADLVAFTQLSNGLDDDSLGDLVETFESEVADVIASQGARLIKTLGDSVLFVTENATAGVDTALRLVEAIGADDQLPDVRVGMASGPVVTRLGDVFGTPVNLAARLTSVARRNRVIVDPDTASRLPRDRFETRVLTARPLRGFGSVEPVAVRRRVS